MFKDISVSRIKLNEILYEKGIEGLTKFKEWDFSGIKNVKLLSILEDVKAYWNDLYRPALTSLSCEVVGGNPRKASTASIIITLAIVGMGIHDDLIDRSKTKHDKRTVFGRYTLEEALLAGDYLLVQAQALANKVMSKVSSKKLNKINEILENFFNSICDGEFTEILHRKNINVDLEEYHKTLWNLGSDIEACTKFGAVMGNGTRSEVKSLGKYGANLGYISRLAEDVKDTLNIRGNLSHRLRYESIPLPILYTAHSSKDNMIEMNTILQQPIINIRELLQLCFEAKAFVYVQNLAREKAREGINKLQIIEHGPALDSLTLVIQEKAMDCRIV
jgi:geranylgeranyl pyrophosphate synthase